ncbi:MAG TPA: type II CAAX endopeptidase family protein [Vicinamibacterales bacterium]|nr:type II CAAX endopeptidase family protein [Vicinamibacterales bacterium]
MAESEPSEIVIPPRPLTNRRSASGTTRLVALLEVIVCSDFPTQIAIGGLLTVAGVAPLTADGGLSLRYVTALSLIDTALLVSLIFVFLRASGERPADVFLGKRRIDAEIVSGLWLSLAAFVIAVTALGIIMQVAPGLHTVPVNPLQGLMQRPIDAIVFAVVVVLAGGVREEIQRAFLLRRFEQSLGGPIVGVIVTSVVFGSGHFAQGADAMIVTAVLGAFWGIIYLRRRSAVAPIVSHSGFNLLQLIQFVTFGR